MVIHEKRVIEAPADRRIVLTRLFDASKEQLFEAWTKPWHVSEWWGPNGSTTTIREMDVTPSGLWRFVMRGPDGVDHRNTVVYIEVVSTNRLVFASSRDDARPGTRPYHVTVVFNEQGGQTQVTVRTLYNSIAERDAKLKAGAIREGIQTLARLARYLPRMSRPESVN
ncbi:SRPBCC domain-containing protein [Singulisphaera sp. PoT]|uniref:SRPBCC domain-containing protein n=1 Tax=Singulisphaera sp. PoT TaxID=3411797 RepID=UPI003BF5280C